MALKVSTQSQKKPDTNHITNPLDKIDNTVYEKSYYKSQRYDAPII